MIAAWMLYVITVSAVLGAAAWLAEKILRDRDVGTRAAWAGALGGSILLGVLAGLPSRDGSALLAPAGASARPVVGLARLVIAPGPGLRSLDGPLTVVWVLMSGLLAGLWVLHVVRTRYVLRTGLSGQSEGLPTVETADLGPALMGVIRPRLIVPSWLSELQPALRALALDHERAHLQARDPALLGFGFAALVAMPWNPVAWWLGRQLRLAIELDCDRRVLRRRPGERRRYCTLLLEVATRSTKNRSPALTLSLRSTSIERRLRNLAGDVRQMSRARLATAAGSTALLVVVACLAPGPDGGSGVTAPDLESSSTVEDLSQDPSFTPFTVAPDIKNRSEVVAALRAEYPPLLRDAGVEGTVQVWFFIDGQGRVRNTRVNQGSGHAALDQAALRVASVFEYTPALDGDKPVPVWVSLPITFRSQ